MSDYEFYEAPCHHCGNLVCMGLCEQGRRFHAPVDHAASPRVADALWNLLVALGKHSPAFSQDALADICPACDEASKALIASGRVMG